MTDLHQCDGTDGRCRCTLPDTLDTPSLTHLLTVWDTGPELCSDNAAHALEQLAVDLAREVLQRRESHGCIDCGHMDCDHEDDDQGCIWHVYHDHPGVVECQCPGLNHSRDAEEAGDA